MLGKGEARESFWEDVIIRAVNSETGCGRQRLACEQGDAVHRFSALNACQRGLRGPGRGEMEAQRQLLIKGVFG